MDIEKIAQSFDFGSRVLSAGESKIGHINSTFIVECENGRYVVQRINKSVFKEPAKMMANVVGVTDHIRQRLAAAGGDTANGTLQFLRSRDRYYYIDDEGEYWRAYRFVDGDCHKSCDSPALFSRVGAAFGNFQNVFTLLESHRLVLSITVFRNRSWATANGSP
jgi:hypothetical protein